MERFELTAIARRDPSWESRAWIQPKTFRSWQQMLSSRADKSWMAWRHAARSKLSRYWTMCRMASVR